MCFMNPTATDNVPRMLEAGQTIRETYEVERFLGEGAFAEVYRVKHRFLGRQAMKVFKRVGMGLEEIHDLLGEAILLSRIGHPNIVRVFDANILETDEGVCGYFTMENVAGGSLDKFWRSHGGSLVPLATSLDLAKQVCRGIALAHSEQPPIIHRDIKPQNILVGYEANGLRARVSDFGLAKKVNPLTLLATSAGTLAFKSPEAFSQQKGDSCAGDVWAIGTTLYLLLTDRLPLVIPSEADWGKTEHFRQKIVAPSEFNPDVDGNLDALVLRALEKNPENRFSTAKEMLDSLDAWTPGKANRAGKGALSSSAASKTVLVAQPQSDAADAETLTKSALKAGQAGRLVEAADLMEEAFNKAPGLRTKYSQQVKLWRCGISM